jgi:hypothetical protein
MNIVNWRDPIEWIYFLYFTLLWDFVLMIVIDQNMLVVLK